MTCADVTEPLPPRSCAHRTPGEQKWAASLLAGPACAGIVMLSERAKTKMVEGPRSSSFSIDLRKWHEVGGKEPEVQRHQKKKNGSNSGVILTAHEDARGGMCAVSAHDEMRGGMRTVG